MNTPKLDRMKLTPEQRDRLEQYEQTQEQLRTLQDIADITQEMLGVLDGRVKDESKTSHNIGALLTDMRTALQEINKKETPESPDYSKPVVDAVSKLEKAIKAIEVKPNVTVDAPQVNVSPPSIDLKGVEKAVQGLAKSFEQAVKLIPKIEIPETDNTELLQAWEGISEQLLSIETATRLKPQFPNTLKVTNPDGTNIGGGSGTLATLAEFNVNDIEESTTSYFGYTEPDGTWMIKELTDTSVSYATVTNNGAVTTYTDAWAGRAGLTFGRIDEAF